MEQFYIDRQFGLAIWIDVEEGIVQRCYNETDEYNAKMNEKYVGKSIKLELVNHANDWNHEAAYWAKIEIVSF